MTLSDYDKKVLRLGEAWKLACEEEYKLMDKFKAIGYTGNCRVGLDNNANIEIIYCIDKEEEDKIEDNGKTEAKHD